MFGGIMGYVAGRPFALLSNRGLALKLGADDRDRLIAAGGAPLRIEPDAPPSRSYTLVPDAMLVLSDALSGWIACSAAHVVAAPAKPPRRAKAAPRR
jgi:TfoX/Sxy family transcriptional regulator of competence genes